MNNVGFLKSLKAFLAVGSAAPALGGFAELLMLILKEIYSSSVSSVSSLGLPTAAPGRAPADLYEISLCMP